MSKIKICGLWREEDMEAANEARPDYIGFVFAESKRRVTPAQAERLRKRLDEGILPVGVFVGAPLAEMAALWENGVISLIQLHGGESAAEIAALREICPAPVIRALRMDKTQCLTDESGADFLLLDSAKAGSGKAFDWGKIGAVEKPYFLAGGIGLHNIEEALALKPYAVDMSGGAETDGLKDREKMIELVKKARETI